MAFGVSYLKEESPAGNRDLLKCCQGEGFVIDGDMVFMKSDDAHRVDSQKDEKVRGPEDEA
jgi:hypothetical protein